VAATDSIVWVGRAISALVSLVFAMSAFMKLRGGAEVMEGMTHLVRPLPPRESPEGPHPAENTLAAVDSKTALFPHRAVSAPLKEVAE